MALSDNPTISGGATRSTIDRAAVSLICAAAMFAVCVLVVSLVRHERWHSVPDMLRAYGLPAIVAIALLSSLRLRNFWRVNIAVTMIPAILAFFAADLVFAEKHRRDFHVVAGKRVVRFERDMRIDVLRRRGIAAYSVVSPQHLAFWRHFVRLDSTDLYPLAGISHVITYLCTEADRDVLYRSDEFGFNNPVGVWNRPIDLAIVGDSFAHGVCVPEADQIATLIRASIPATLNAGILGAGPLAELGVVREYLSPHRPRMLAWLFYEGNDVDTLGQQTKMARRYLDSTFSQHLISRQAEIDALLRGYEDRVIAAPVERGPRDAALADVLMLRHLRTALDVGLPAWPPRPPDDYDGLEKSLTAAKNAVDAWGGTMYLVYLPDSHRFDPLRVTSEPQHDDRVVYSRTMDIAHKLGMPVIDMLPVFSADRDPKRFWYRPMSHYTPAGMQLVARTVLARLASDGKNLSR